MIDLPKIEKVIKELLPLKGKTIIKVKTVIINKYYILSKKLIF